MLKHITLLSLLAIPAALSAGRALARSAKRRRRAGRLPGGRARSGARASTPTPPDAQAASAVGAPGLAALANHQAAAASAAQTEPQACHLSGARRAAASPEASAPGASAPGASDPGASDSGASDSGASGAVWPGSANAFAAARAGSERAYVSRLEHEVAQLRLRCRGLEQQGEARERAHEERVARLTVSHQQQAERMRADFKAVEDSLHTIMGCPSEAFYSDSDTGLAAPSSIDLEEEREPPAFDAPPEHAHDGCSEHPLLRLSRESEERDSTALPPPVRKPCPPEAANRPALAERTAPAPPGQQPPPSFKGAAASGAAASSTPTKPSWHY